MDLEQPMEPWHSLGPDEVVGLLETDPVDGLGEPEVQHRLARYGPNEIEGEAPPSKLQIARNQIIDPMNLMLVGVTIVSLVIGEVSTAVLVGVLVGLNVVLGARQEIKAQEAVDALARLQVPNARVRRGGTTVFVPVPGLVPGDVVLVEAGDVVPADGRLLRSATLETQEAALTGESAPIPKDAATLPGDDVELGDRSNMLFQNTSVTRGSGAMVVTATGMSTEMGRIAGMLSSVERKRSPLQRELDSLTKVLGAIAWGAVALILLIGWTRDLDTSELLLVGTAMAISAIPTGLPTFVQMMLSYGSRQLADAKAVVKNLTDVETLGATSAINSDKTGTLTMNEMMVSRLYHAGSFYEVDGSGYEMEGAIRAVAGEPDHDFTRFAYGLVLASDASVSRTGEVVGDPTEAALVVLAGKLGVSAEETRRAFPRLAEVPFDSSYKFMATLHRVEIGGEIRLVVLTKGAPDVVLARCDRASTRDGGEVGIGQMESDIQEANDRLGSEGLRVLAFAARVVPTQDEQQAIESPTKFVENLRFEALAGIIDPLRPSSKRAVAVATAAGIDVRMITGDHKVTALAIGKELGLGPGALSGAEFRDLPDDEVVERLDEIHVLGRVTPEDKLRLVRLMQSQGTVVAMTGDAVNDAAALKQADIGVAMGSGSEVTKQAARMILTDDNFGTLVRAIELGRSIYQKIALYVRYQMSQLLALVLLFLSASVFNIADGMALTPIMALFLNFFIAGAPVIAILFEPVNPGIMRRPPRDPAVPLANGREVIRWLIYGATLFVVSLVPLLFGPDTPSSQEASVSMTMAFVTMGLGSLATGLATRRDPETGLAPPAAKALGILGVSAVLTIIATTWTPLQELLRTTTLTSRQWAQTLGLATVVLVVIEVEKWLRRKVTDERGSFPASPISAGPEVGGGGRESNPPETVSASHRF